MKNISTPFARAIGTLRAAIALRAAHARAREAVLALILSWLDAAFARLDALLAQWRVGALPPVRRDASSKGGRRARREGEEESSFCEQKEAKKLHSWESGFPPVVARARQQPLSPRPHTATRALPPFNPKAMDKVFLLLFVHKKKTLPVSFSFLPLLLSRLNTPILLRFSNINHSPPKPSLDRPPALPASNG